MYLDSSWLENMIFAVCVCVGGGYVCAHVCVHILYNLFQLTVSYLVRDSEP